MKKENFNFTMRLFNFIKLFFQNERGVYAVITALLAFPLLLLVAFAVDGTGLLLDKARLAQATDQAALLLIAEDNQYRKNKDHSDVNRQNVTQQEIDKEGSFSTAKNQAQWKKRNQELVQGLVKLYLRSDDNEKNSSPVIIKDPFEAECVQEITQPKNPNSNARSVACTVQGSVERKFWLPWTQTLASSSQLHDGRLGINSGKTYAVKEKQITIPIDLMMVTDFSGSMMFDLEGNKTDNDSKRRIKDLRDVVEKVSKGLLPEKKDSNVSDFNRIGFTAFAAGARPKDIKQKCVLPYKMKQGSHRFKIKKSDAANLGVRTDLQSCRSTKLRDSRQGNQYDVEACDITAAPTDILKKVLHSGTGAALSAHWEDTVKLMFDDMLDTKATIDSIGQNTSSSYEFDFNDGGFCLGGKDKNDKATTQAWFDQNNRDVTSAFKRIVPYGGTAVTSGMLIGANLLMDKNTNPEAQPAKIGTNTRRVLLILSDGEDNFPTFNTLTKLINDGLCTKIREKAEALQDSKYPIAETRIAFIAFGTKLPRDQEEAWKNRCVDEKQFYEVKDREGLFKAFEQIITFEEEVGRSSSQKPKFFQ